MYVRGFRDAGVPLNHLRDASRKYRSEWKTPYPLATKRFAINGRRLLCQLGNIWQEALSGQHCAFFDELGKQLVHIGDLTSEWRPLGNDRTVVLAPARAFGKPIDDISGTHTFVLSQAIQAEQDPKAVAWWFGTTESAVLDAVEFESKWLSAA